MKYFKILFLFTIAFLLMVSGAFAAGSVTLSDAFTKNYQGNAQYYVVTCTCVGDSSDGSIPDTAIASGETGISFGGPVGWILYKVIADPGTTAPDAADVYVKDSGGDDLLDGRGANLLHATATQAIKDINQPVVGTITLDVDNQATVSATYVITLVFYKASAARGVSVPVLVSQGGTGATTLTDGGVLLGSGTSAITAMAVLTDGQMIVGDGTTDPAAESGATLRTSIGVGTGDSPQFTGIELGHATDTTIARSGSGDLTIEGNAVFRVGGKVMREFCKLDLTADTSISEAQIIANKYISNQGDDGEADLTLPAVSYAAQVFFLVEEAQNIEINPPSGEAFDLDGVTLDANDCVDSDSTVGSKISCLRMQNASGTWIWSLDTIRGAWTDRGASD